MPTGSRRKNISFSVTTLQTSKSTTESEKRQHNGVQTKGVLHEVFNYFWRRAGRGNDYN